jgi:hypothetical protein
MVHYQILSVPELLDEDSKIGMELALEDLLGSRFSAAIDAHVSRHGPFLVGTGPDKAQCSQFDADIKHEYGFVVTAFDTSDPRAPILYGHLCGQIGDCFSHVCEKQEFEVGIDNDDDAGRDAFWGGQPFSTFYLKDYAARSTAEDMARTIELLRDWSVFWNLTETD